MLASSRVGTRARAAAVTALVVFATTILLGATTKLTEVAKILILGSTTWTTLLTIGVVDGATDYSRCRSTTAGRLAPEARALGGKHIRIAF